MTAISILRRRSTAVAIGVAFTLGALSCSTAPADSSPVGTWTMVDLNNSPLPLFDIKESHLVITADGRWSDYFNNSTVPSDQGSWTYNDGHLSLDAPIHGDGFVAGDRLQVEWGYRDVYHYRRAQK
jgi:hypothetical protein